MPQNKCCQAGFNFMQACIQECISLVGFWTYNFATKKVHQSFSQNFGWENFPRRRLWKVPQWALNMFLRYNLNDILWSMTMLFQTNYFTCCKTLYVYTKVIDIIVLYDSDIFYKAIIWFHFKHFDVNILI